MTPTAIPGAGAKFTTAGIGNTNPLAGPRAAGIPSAARHRAGALGAEASARLLIVAGGPSQAPSTAAAARSDRVDSVRAEGSGPIPGAAAEFPSWTFFTWITQR